MSKTAIWELIQLSAQPAATGIILISYYSFAIAQVSSVTKDAPKNPIATPFEAKPDALNVNSEPAGDFNEDPFKNYRYEDPFLISDPFQDEETPAATVTKEPIAEQKVENFFDKFSFDDVGDPFANEKFTTTTTGNDGNNNFDPFGAPVAETAKKKTPSGFGFEADFSKFDPFNDTTTSTKTNGSSVDAWGGSLDKKNNNSAGKVQKFNKQEVSKINKFSADYSDNFETDIEQVLKRSVTDQ